MKLQKKLQKKVFLLHSRGTFYILYMTIFILISACLLIALILLQVKDGGLNVTLTSTLQAPTEKR